MPSELLRFKDLKRYGVSNWPSLGRWITKEGAPTGFYLGSNTRVWYKKDWDEWLANRPQAGPPPENVKGAGAVDAAPDARKPKPPSSPTKIKRIGTGCPTLPNGRGAE
jgi:predicted DNA-binding transcriptional regulator AlpA